MACRRCGLVLPTATFLECSRFCNARLTVKVQLLLVLITLQSQACAERPINQTSSVVIANRYLSDTPHSSSPIAHEGGLSSLHQVARNLSALRSTQPDRWEISLVAHSGRKDFHQDRHSLLETDPESQQGDFKLSKEPYGQFNAALQKEEDVLQKVPISSIEDKAKPILDKSNPASDANFDAQLAKYINALKDIDKAVTKTEAAEHKRHDEEFKQVEEKIKKEEKKVQEKSQGGKDEKKNKDEKPNDADGDKEKKDADADAGK